MQIATIEGAYADMKAFSRFVSGAVAAEILARVRSALPGCRAIVVSDYQKGVATAKLLRAVLALARRAGVPVLVDPKVRHFPRYKRVALVTPNQGGATNWLSPSFSPQTGLLYVYAKRAFSVQVRSEDELESVL